MMFTTARNHSASQKLRWAWTIAAATGVLSAAEIAEAQWQVTFEVLKQPDPYRANATAAAPGSVVGFSGFDFGSPDGPRPAMWVGAERTYVDLTPNRLYQGAILAATGTHQGGYVACSSIGIEMAAAIWQGTAASYVSLRPAGMDLSVVRAMAGSQQVGEAYNPATSGKQAAMWNGTVYSYVNLHPTNAYSSAALATDGVRQGGWIIEDYTKLRAVLWNSSPDDYVDLTPDGKSAIVLGMAEGEQVGFISTEFSESGYKARPVLWHDTKQSMVDLLPAGWLYGRANATVGGFEVGEVSNNLTRHAVLWAGSAESMLDLHLTTGNMYDYTIATGLSRNGDVLEVTGIGYRNGYYQDALVWTVLVPEPTTTLTVGLTLLLLRRRGR